MTKSETRSGARAGSKDGTGSKRAPAAAPSKAPATPANAEMVGAFLAENPDWLIRHPEILVPVHRTLGEGVVDLQGAMIDRLRAENAHLRQSRDELLETGRANMASQERIHDAILAVLDCRSFRELIETITTDFSLRLDVDVIVLAVESDEPVNAREVADIVVIQPGGVDYLIGPGCDLDLRADAAADPLLYGGISGLVKSEALVRLHASPDAPVGILAMGSRKAGRFSPEQGSELLGFLGRVLELTIGSWLNLPRS